MNIRQNAWLVAVAANLLLVSCKKDSDLIDPQTPTTTGTDQSVNDWILGNMREVYYWSDKIPANPDKTLAPAKFFDSLLYTYDPTQRPDGDRFSWIQESADDLKASLSGESKATGMEFTLLRRAQGSNDVIAQVLYVLPNTPASRAGLKRGDIIYKVNGQNITVDNYSSLLFSPTSFTFGLAKLENRALVNTDETRSVTAEVLQENPVFLDSVYAIGGKKIGYLVYNQFNPAPNGSKVPTYDQKIDQIFSQFKTQGINELVLDLRYNPGGYVSSSTNIASLVGRGIDNSKVYYRQEWNAFLSTELKKEYGNNFGVEYFQNKTQNIGGNLQRVFVLTTGQTASASELIINGLKPFMQVITVGTTTTGKNVGSITISDDTGKIKWGMQPIVFKSFNSAGQSDYASGFKPNVEIAESVSTRTKQLGDVSEALLGEAIYQITGSRTARRAAQADVTLPEVGSSLSRKAGGSNMFDASIKLPQ
ncbi:S41 family peptidase [Tellurirhabdus bombi]|uniref:S41 family peptidase n=1 Tax=Tellurirhabdus bombi TaxID=2907205 RepID=UPI001F2DED14|nr:S41 family peptidase [Tellurirhabdus bombi]